MPYEMPTLPALITRTQSDYERNAPDALRRSDAKVASRVLSGAAYGLYGHQEWIARQSHPATCDEEMLLRWAQWRLKDGRKAAVAATGPIGVVGAANALVDAGMVYQHDDGRRYVVTVTTRLVGGTAQVPVRAETPGALGNIESGTLTAVSPALGVNPEATIGAAGLAGGADQEEIEQLRTRVQAAFQNPSKVGSGSDFEEWALEVPGVTRAWALPRWMGPGTFGLMFVCDGEEDIFPGADKVAEVQAYLDIKRPVTAEVYAFAPINRVIGFTIKLTPDGAALREEVRKSLATLIADEGGPGSRLYRTHIRSAISNTPGETDHDLPLPAADVLVANNEMGTLGAITWL
ncbi:baseplate J/gp47 family protein [Pseudomonas putida]|uniref:baseplate J/gp47 family protein n=1 Tax=Pseudomonas putida TaxID=303 RepID=UPI00346640D7